MVLSPPDFVYLFLRLASPLPLPSLQDLTTNGGFFPRVAPPEGFGTHLDVLREITLLRCREVRGSFEDDGYVPEYLSDLNFRLKKLLNGDLRQPCVQHYCHEDIFPETCLFIHFPIARQLHS